MIEVVTAATLPAKIAADTALQTRFDALDGEYEPAGLVLNHNESTDPHPTAEFVNAMAYLDGVWTRVKITIWERIEGDPDPVSSMAENDVIIDGTSV